MNTFLRIPVNSLFYTFLSLLFLCSSLTFANDYVGSEQCSSCHEKEQNEWETSQHSRSMSHASDATVLADFNNVSLNFAGKENKFYRKGEEFWVYIAGFNGQFEHYQIKYTFAVDPLQQYMVELKDGRVQLIPFAWDSRSTEQGGQRWFHLYPQFTNDTDEFFWLNQGQNWNYMCADCHSTNLQKNYDIEQDTYETTWSEINVACEACHGPASAHLKWTKDEPKPALKHYGFNRDLGKAVDSWQYQEGKSTLQPSAIHPTEQTRTCAQCHSRRTLLKEEKTHVKGDFLDRHLLSLITPELYHKDGQIYDEDFVYGSFLQSKMQQNGVVCSDCHNPHTGKIKMPEPELCMQCHVASEYLNENHSFHKAGLETDKCSSCHMTEELYMQVDLRKDHSWQVPRPDLSIKHDVPNACNKCHEDKSNEWALETQKTWFPNSKYLGKTHFSDAFAMADSNQAGSEKALLRVINDSTESDIIKASALERMQTTPSQESLSAVQATHKSKSALIKLGAISASKPFPNKYKWPLLSPFLNDAALTVRTEAAAELLNIWPQLNQQQRATMQVPLDEYKEIQEFVSDRGHGRTNIGNTHQAKGEFDLAEQAYLGAIKVEPIFAAAYINLAEVYRATGKQQKSLDVLKGASSYLPDDANIAYATGMAYIRMKQLDNAISMLEKTTQLAPSVGQYFYVLGMAYEQKGSVKSANAYSKAYRVSNNPEHLYAYCNVLVKQKSFSALSCLKELEVFYPTEAKALKAKL